MALEIFRCIFYLIGKRARYVKAGGGGECKSGAYNLQIKRLTTKEIPLNIKISTPPP